MSDPLHPTPPMRRLPLPICLEFGAFAVFAAGTALAGTAIEGAYALLLAVAVFAHARSLRRIGRLEVLER